MDTRRGRILLGVGGAAIATTLALALWPTAEDQAGYPLARRVLGQQPQPLWELGRDDLRRHAARDAVSLRRHVAEADVALSYARANESLLATQDVEALAAEQRAAVRSLWWSFVEPLRALDHVRARYAHWYGVDYVRHPDLHAMAFGLSFAALCAQVAIGHALLDLVAGHDRAQALFDEAMPEQGLPAGSFSELRARLLRVRDQGYLLVGKEWFDQWIAIHLAGSDTGVAVRDVATEHRARADRWAPGVGTALATAQNKAELVRSMATESFFPVQREVAEWFGDTRVVPADRRLVSDDQITALQRDLEPGDVLVERRNWYLSNVGLPGFWPHAALYVGTQDEVREAFDGDDEVTARFGARFSEHLARTHAEAWRALGGDDPEGHPHRVVEAVSEGVVAASLEHSCGADYVAALRPRGPAVTRAVAIDRALTYFGRPYDFDFDFATDDAIVCSELVMKAYEGAIEVPFITVAGRRAIPPTEIVRVFAAELRDEEPQLEFVAFLDGRERERRAVVADAAALASTVLRPKWDIMQR